MNQVHGDRTAARGSPDPAACWHLAHWTSTTPTQLLSGGTRMISPVPIASLAALRPSSRVPFGPRRPPRGLPPPPTSFGKAPLRTVVLWLK
ncbi:uncharacterized protein SPSK_03788 [Sporothrix schenckii 1099-18]|uniref:Uncharacterized protein n=1 Tax=Sporothrix schenckii 1099-18 TaxID=1397361 RepID=A0A0F2M3K2_SPOSC|nr:uncharacterized protein SPSK_03788 [Sporothrix schenckii 1099-18]KJR82731.1 hypothetical protein SPSK_03788 [Sporothrix schenckii 1099-18]